MIVALPITEMSAHETQFESPAQGVVLPHLPARAHNVVGRRWHGEPELACKRADQL